MAYTISDFKEMDLEEIMRLYKTIHTSFHNTFNRFGHDIPTLNLLREIIILKVNGTLYNEYHELVNELNEGHFDSINRYPISRSDFFHFNQNKKSLGIVDDVIHNSEIYYESITDGFLEEQESDNELEDNVRSILVEGRKEFLYSEMLNRQLTKMELIELKQLNN